MYRIKVIYKIKTRILLLISLLNLTFNEIMWKNIVEPGKPQMTIWRTRIVSWIPKVTNTQLEYVILIAFSQQQWLPVRASMLRYTYCRLSVLLKRSVTGQYWICPWK